jgi:hypothetical protein
VCVCVLLVSLYQSLFPLSLLLFFHFSSSFSSSPFQNVIRPLLS